jgi:glutamate-1-semialdehyde 2,1-aminomutase
VAAAHAFLDVLESENGFYERLEARTQRLASGIQRAVRGAGNSYAVVHVASMVDFMFRDGPPHQNHAEAASADAAAYARYYWAMLERGIHLPPSQMEVMFVTDAHSDEDVDATIDAIREALEEPEGTGGRRSTLL